MPEIPDLEGYRAYFNNRLPGLSVQSAEMPIPWMVRLPREEFEQRIAGQVWTPAYRRAKYLVYPFESGENLVVHAMLTGRFDYSEPKQKRPKMTAFILRLSNAMEFRYYDDRRMGRAYLVRKDEFADKVPRWSEMGPDVMDAELTEERFVDRLRKQRAQIKTVLTTERCIAGIGNAYSDEILWEARIHPYRRRTELSDEQLAGIYRAVHTVMDWSTPIVASLMEEKGLPRDHYRDHLRVHRKGGQTCPRDGHRISEITSGQRITNFCRACQE